MALFLPHAPILQTYKDFQISKVKSLRLEFTYLSGPWNAFKLKNNKQYYIERTFSVR